MKNYSKGIDTDFMWQMELWSEPTTLIVYYQAEQGLAPLLAGASLVGDREPVCKIFSKLHQVEPMNSIPMPTYPEWRLYETYNTEGRRYFILRINHAYIPNATHTKSWLYNYPIFRDIVLELNDYGVDEMVYMTSNTMQDYLLSDQMGFGDDELAVFEQNRDLLKIISGDTNETLVEEAEMLVPSPSWVACNVFENFSLKNNGIYLVVCAKNSMTYLNVKPAERLLLYLYNKHKLEYDNLYYREMCAVLSEVEHLEGSR